MATKIRGILEAQDLKEGDEFQFAGETATVIQTTLLGVNASVIRIEALGLSSRGLIHITVRANRPMEIKR